MAFSIGQKGKRGATFLALAVVFESTFNAKPVSQLSRLDSIFSSLLCYQNL